MSKIRWKKRPERSDFSAAQTYLSLLLEPRRARRLAKALRRSGDVEYFLAKDILRASGLPLLSADDKEVAKEILEVTSNEKLSPILLVRGTPLWIVDGYHRVCACYHLSKKASVASLIVSRRDAVR